MRRDNLARAGKTQKRFYNKNFFSICMNMLEQETHNSLKEVTYFLISVHCWLSTPVINQPKLLYWEKHVTHKKVTYCSQLIYSRFVEKLTF